MLWKPPIYWQGFTRDVFFSLTMATPQLIPLLSQAQLDKFCRAEHRACFACRPEAEGGLGIVYTVKDSAFVEAMWSCPLHGQSYENTVHGGLLATALDSAMVHALFACGVAARTGQLNVRYHNAVRPQEPCVIRAHIKEVYAPLYTLSGEISQGGVVCVRATGKFMEIPSSARAS